MAEVVAAHPEWAQELYDAEVAGKARVTVLDDLAKAVAANAT